MDTQSQSDRWQFWIDRGGTFTDIVASPPDGALITHKLLSENAGQYDDAALAGIRDLLGVAHDAAIPAERIGHRRRFERHAARYFSGTRGCGGAVIHSRNFIERLRNEFAFGDHPVSRPSITPCLSQFHRWRFANRRRHLWWDVANL